MKRWHALLGAAVLVAVGIGFAISSTSGDSLFKETGRRVGLVRKMDDVVVARANGEEISLKEIEVRKAVMAINQQLAGQSNQVSRKDALQALLRIKVQMAEARNLGLVPTDAEVQEQVKLNEANWAKAPADERKRRDTVIADYIEGAGISRAEYDQMDFNATRIEMAVMRLRNSFKSKLTGMDAGQMEKAYSAHVDELVKTAKVDILKEDKLVD